MSNIVLNKVGALFTYSEKKHKREIRRHAGNHDWEKVEILNQADANCDKEFPETQNLDHLAINKFTDIGPIYQPLRMKLTGHKSEC